MSLLFLPLTFRRSFVRSSRSVVVLLPPLPLRYLSSSCFAFGVRYFVYFFMFIFYFILFYLFNCKFGCADVWCRSYPRRTGFVFKIRRVQLTFDVFKIF